MPGYCKKCAVPSCVTDYRVLKRFGVTLRFFSFPKDKSLRNKWLLKCNKSLDDRVKTSSVCSRHFHIDDYEDGVESTIINIKPKRLKSKAIPSLFLEKRPQKLLKKNVDEYHKILAQEILNVEKQEASQSSEPPIYLEFAQCEYMVQKSKSINSGIETDMDQLLDDYNDFDPLEGIGDNTVIDVKEESIIKPYVGWEENHVNENECMENKMDDKDFIGNCYVCDKTIRQRDLGQLSREEFTKIVQKVLEGIGTEYVVVLTEDDGLCGACRSLVARISKLEADLRTTSLGLRALLRLKYSLPPPVLEKQEHSKVQDKFQQLAAVDSCSSRTATVLKDSVTQTAKFFVCPKHKQTQTAPNSVVCKHKKTQTNEPSPQKKSKPEIKVVNSVNEIERLETGDLEEKVSDMSGSSERTVQLSARSEGNNCLFEDISDAAELMTLLDDDCLGEESEVVTENRRQADSLQEAKQPVKRKPVVTKINLGVLKCGRCKFKTKSPEQMKTHMLSFINKEGFYCSICEYAFHKSDNFRRHKIHHSETRKNKRCIFCDEVLHDELNMRFHIEAKHKPNSFTHRCSFCSRVFMFGRDLRRHQLIRHKVMETFECEKCGKTFRDKVKYNSHVEYYHRDSLYCKYCQRQYFTIEKLINHENSKHRFERTQHYKCRYCPKRFVRQDLLPKHEKHHTGQFEHRCGECGIGFHEAESLRKHSKTCKLIMRASRNFGTKPLNWQALKQRLRKYQQEPNGRHDSLICDVCGKMIKTRQKYKIHREMHDSPACFQCHVCGKKFRYKCNLGVHIKNLHADEAQ